MNEPVQEPASVIETTWETSDGFNNSVEEVGLDEAQRRIDRLKRLREARELAKDSPPFELPPRMGTMRLPVLFED